MLKKKEGGKLADDLKRVGLIFKEEGAVDFRKTLQDINIEMNKNYNQFKLTQSQWDSSTKSTEKLKAQQEYLGNAIEIQGDKVNVLRRQLEELENAENKDITAIKKKQNELTNAEIKLKNYENQLKDVTGQLNNSGKAWEENGKKVEKFGKSIEEAGKKMSGLSTVATAGLAGTIATAANFEDSMRQVAATMGITAEEISNGSEAYMILENAAKECGEKTKYSASEAAEALNYMALAGYDAKQSAETLPKVLNLAAAGNLDLATASDMVTDAMAALGMQTSDLDKYIDEMAKTSQKSNTSVAQLGEATLTCAGTVKLAGMSLETMNAELGILANNGIKGAEGGTHLRNIILSLTSPTDVAAKALKNLGIKVTDSSGNIRDMNDIMADFNKKLDGMSDEKKTNIISQIFNKTDISAVNALIKGSGEEFANLKAQVSNCNGAAQDMADTMNSSLKGQLTLVKSQLEGIAIKLGNKLMPIVKDCVKKISDLATWFSNLNDKQAETVLKIAGIVAAAGPLLTIVGKLTSTIGGTMKAIGKVTQMISATASPVGIAVAGIGSLAGAYVLLNEQANKLPEELQQIVDETNEAKKSHEEYRNELDKTTSSSLAEIQNSENLRNELSKLVDENGKVKDGYKDRVAFILNELNEALGTEYSLTGDVIDKYKELQQQIDLLILKKKAQIILENEEGKYTTAIKNKNDAYQKMIDAQNEYNKSLDGKTYEQYFENLKQNYMDAGYTAEKSAEHAKDYMSKWVDGYKETYETNKGIYNDYLNDIAKYENDFAISQSENTEKIKQMTDERINNYSRENLSKQEQINIGIQQELYNIEELKKLYEQDMQNQNEISAQANANAIKSGEERLQTLIQNLIAQTSIVNENSPEVINAWKELATNSYGVYYNTISPMDHDLKVKIEQMTGVTAEKTPELVAETQKMSQQVIDEVNKNSEFKEKALENLKGYLNGLEDTELRELLKEAGIENADKVIQGIKEGNLAEDQGMKILDSLNNGLKNKTWKDTLFDTARGIASTLSGLLTVKASVNGKKSALPGHKSGLDYVPYDDYIARLHKGERVLTAKENKSLEAAQRISRKSNLEFSTSSNHANMINIDYNKIANAFLTALNKCKLTLDEDGFARIVKDELYKVV